MTKQLSLALTTWPLRMRCTAGLAEARHVGIEAVRLRGNAVEAGDDAAAISVIVVRTVTLARRVQDPQSESAALDQRMAMRKRQGQGRDAARTAMGRTELLASKRVRDLPSYREEGHVVTGRLLLGTVLAGD